MDRRDTCTQKMKSESLKCIHNEIDSEPEAPNPVIVDSGYYYQYVVWSSMSNEPA